jgi:hypothetical protein
MVMRNCIAATLSIAVAIGPASALDLGLGGKAGGVEVGASVGVGSKAASVGVGASVGGIGGANAGASVDTSNGSVGANVGGVGNVGSVSSGVSAGVDAGSGSSVGGGTSADSGSTAGGTDTTPGSTAKSSAVGAESAGVGGIGTTTVIGPAAGVRHSIALPPILLPSRSDHDHDMSVRGTVGYPLRTRALMRAIPGTPSAVVRVCRSAIVSAATPHGAVRVQAVSAGPLSRQRRGALTAPVEVRIDYARQGGIEVRRARIRCRLDAAGRVMAVL